MEETLSLQELFKTIRKRLLLITCIVLFAVGAAAVVSYNYLTPIYESSTQILINQPKESTSSGSTPDIQTNLQLINTYNVIIKSHAILSIVIEKMELNTTPSELHSKVSVNSAQNSQVINVSVQDINLERSVQVANTIAEVFQEEIKMLMNMDNVNVLSPAIYNENQSPIKPSPILNIAIAAVMGLMVGTGIAFMLEYLDTTIKTEQDIEEFLGLPMLGFVSPISPVKMKKIKKSSSEKGKGRLMNV
ncbi:YveK family protein [Sporosarcina siberiensis]|uniref:YveK family protein n=1 Tax=Sporosarcina siberiensis TaxID=1365606 RepID=A0ABW4SC70_9BACL